MYNAVQLLRTVVLYAHIVQHWCTLIRCRVHCTVDTSNGCKPNIMKHPLLRMYSACIA